MPGPHDDSIREESRWRRATPMVALAVLAVAAYASALANGFVWDDHAVIEHGRWIGSLGNIPRLFLHDASFNSDGGRFAASATVDTYRPLTLATFFVERALFGLRPAWFHLVSVLVHAANALALRAVGVRLGVRAGAATAGAALFAVHPAISEAVHWINGRSDPLYLLGLLAALWVWLAPDEVAGARRVARGAVTALAFCAATLCKETAFVAALPVVLLVRVRAPRAGVRDALVSLVPWVAGGALGLALRYVGLHRAAVAAGGGHVAYALARLPVLWLDALTSLATPVAWMQPSLYESYRVVPAWRTAVALVVVLALVVVTVERARRGRVLPAFALAVFLLTTAPVALLTYAEGWSGWGRYLYAPGAFAMLVIADEVALACGEDARRRRAAAAGCAVVVALFAVQTFATGSAWRDDRARAARQVEQYPDVSMGYSELAVQELRAGRPDAALARLERAVRLAPGNARHWSRAAQALMAQGRRREAFGAAQRALALNAEDTGALYIAAIGLLGQGREAEAARALVRVVGDDPGQAGPWNTLREARARLGGDSVFARAAREAASEPRNAHVAERVIGVVGR